ncbi:GAF domain-containing protein [Kineococcus rhizosphaerae]|uniref:GAF domain-containing protein n=1 Tax=Kineococcus rhizosphaerae TaxID=559628 RepID=A0A2T0R0P8_9ACTN|nr:GAF domain-containing protein [Kineococcus rhizosphaerae]
MGDTERVRAILLELAPPGTRPQDLPQRLVDACDQALTVSGVGLALMTSEAVPAGLVAASDEVARTLEDLQFTLGEGPCLDASRTGRPVLVPDLASADRLVGGRARWPGFAAAAIGAGAAAVFALPLRIGLISIGVLDLYRDRVGPLDRAELAEALAYATAASRMLLTLRTPPEDTGGEPAWHVPLAHDRAVVHQATGVISVTAQVDLADALVLLRARAWKDDRPVDEVAADVVAGRLRFGPDTAWSPG